MRIPKPFYREQTKCWYVQLGKKQIRLAADREEAVQKYHQLMAGRQAATADTEVIAILRQFLEWNKARKASSTHEFYRRHVISFAESIGTGLTVGQLKPFHVTRWIDERYAGQSDNYRRSAIRSVQRAFNWAVKEGYLDKSPLAHVQKPPYTPRDTIITAAQWDELTSALGARGEEGRAFLDFLTILRHTGCRPQEARLAEARHLDEKARCLVFERTESKGYGSGRTIERRVVPLTDVAFDICKRLAAQFPAGPLLRNSKGTSWTRYAIKGWCKRLDQSRYETPSVKRVSFRLSVYTIRHTWATDALERGVDPVTVATIMGHKDLTMLMKVYQHLEKKGQHLRNALHQAIGAAAPVDATTLPVAALG